MTTLSVSNLTSEKDNLGRACEHSVQGRKMIACSHFAAISVVHANSCQRLMRAMLLLSFEY